MRREKARFRMFSAEVSKLLALSVITVAFFLALAESVGATSVYSQNAPADPVGAFSSSNKPGGQKVADNFILAGIGPAVVRSVRFIGGYGLTNPPPLDPPLDELPTDGFRVVFFEDAAGRPGLPIPGGDFLITSSVSRFPTGGRLLNGSTTPIQHVIDLGEGISLNPSTEYWISITNDPGPDHGWTWARASGILDDQTAGTRNDIAVGPWNVFSNGGMFFELNDENIPEPSSVVILSLVMISALLMRHRVHRSDECSFHLCD